MTIFAGISSDILMLILRYKYIIYHIMLVFFEG